MTARSLRLSPHPLSPSPQMWRGGTTDGLRFPSPEGRGDQRGEDRGSRGVVILSRAALSYPQRQSRDRQHQHQTEQTERRGDQGVQRLLVGGGERDTGRGGIDEAVR